MAGEIVVPSLGESVSEASVAKWFKKVGDAITQDEPLIELETDKVTLEVNAPASGKLKDIKIGEGKTVEVGTLLGLIEVGAAGAKSAPAKAEAPKAAAPAPAAAASDKQSGPAARKLMDEAGLSASSLSGTGKDGRVTKGDVLSAMNGAAGGGSAPAQARGAPAAGGPGESG